MKYQEIELEEMELAITVKEEATDILATFPYLDGQYLDRQEEEQGSDNIILYVYLNNHTDTTIAQETYLDTNPNVITYDIV